MRPYSEAIKNKIIHLNWSIKRLKADFAQYRDSYYKSLRALQAELETLLESENDEFVQILTGNQQ